jgi:hypothetical protein
VPFDAEPLPISAASTFVTVFTVERDAGGWSVTGWRSSGC